MIKIMPPPKRVFFFPPCPHGVFVPCQALTTFFTKKILWERITGGTLPVMVASPPNPELQTLQKVIARLDRGRIPHMLTGSMALNFYGHPRATNDFDIVIEILPADADRIYQLFEDDFYISREALGEAMATSGIFNVIDNQSVFKIDFIIAKKEPFSMEQFARRRTKELAGMKIDVISPEDLILAKLMWARESASEMQERDVKNLVTLLSKELDYPYMEKWALLLGLLERLRSFYAPP